MLLYPTIQTINYAFANADSTEYVGLDNFKFIFKSDEFWQAITNNLLWLLIVPALTVVFGVIVAVLADKLSATGEKVSKSFIFLPMAISFVGASAIWLLVYQYDPASEDATGALNAVWRALGGGPQTWLQNSGLRLNSILLMVILVWLQVGFAMILLSSAIKGVPGGHDRGGPHRRGHRAADLLPGRHPADPRHHHHGLRHHVDPGAEGLRHRLRPHQRT